MAKNPNAARCGYAVVVPDAKAPPPSSSITSRGGLDQFESSTKSVYKDPSSGYAHRFDETHKGGEFVDGRSGRHGYREAVSYKETVKVNDAYSGRTDEYQTEVKFQKTTTYPASSSYNSSKNNHIGYY